MFTWIWFIFGLICAFVGIFMMANNEYINIKGKKFDGEILGIGFVTIGGILAALMLIAKGIVWMTSVGG